MPIAELRVTGAPWLTRSNATLAGVAGIRPDGGFVITSIDRHERLERCRRLSAAARRHRSERTPRARNSPERDARSTNSSMRIQAGNMSLYASRRSVLSVSRRARRTSWRFSSCASGAAVAATAGARAASSDVREGRPRREQLLSATARR